MLNQIIHGDCLTESDNIESGSVDLILTDPPYGTMKGQGNSPAAKSLGLDNCEWDESIDPVKLFEVANRILRKNGKLILFSQEPYTSRLITEAIPNLPFSYKAIWEKPNAGNPLKSKKAMLCFYEDILIFSKAHPKHDFEGFHPLRAYFKIVMDYIGLSKKEIIDCIGQRADHTFRTDSTQFGLCTESTYNELIQVFSIDKMQGFKTYAELKPIDIEYRQNLIKEMTEQYPSTFNLWEGKKYKSNILKYKKDYTGLHPTQKPILLLEDLIKTFSNEGDLVVDLTIGSGSTAIAALNTGRFFIGIEKDDKYFEIATKRVQDWREQQSARAEQMCINIKD